MDAARDTAYAAAVRRLVTAMSEDVEATSELEAVGGMLVAAARELIPSADCVITVVPPDRQDLFKVIAGAGTMASQLPGTEWPVPGTLNWQAMSGGEVIETTNAQQSSSGLPPVFAEGGVNTARLVPLRIGTALSDGRVGVGVFSFWRTGDEPFTDQERVQMDDLAELASLFIRRVELGRAARKSSNRMAGIEEVKTEFLNLASHELRGPLAVVQGYISMMEEGALKGAQVKAILPVISGKLRQMNVLISEMLETARLEDHRLQLTLTEVELGTITRRAAGSCVSLLKPKHQFETILPTTEITVRADPTRLEAMITNLVDNAIKYSPDGGLVRVSVSRVGNLARVTVSDQGLGIAENDLARLFTRFGRLVTPENSHIPGTGLGLYLSRQLARMHGGDISVATRPGAGSTFTLTLPL
jgi:signal transduction histidine kinase